MQHLIVYFLIVSQFLMPIFSWAKGTELTELKGPQQTAEYIFRNSTKDSLISVQVFGSVSRPGMYYVPEDTDLMKLLTLAGGALNSSELEEVFVRKIDSKSWKALGSDYVDQVNANTYEINVDKMLKKAVNLKPLRMAHDDFVYIPQKEPFISNDLSKVITIGSVLLTSVLTYVLIKKNSD